jgi:hypothetical protein
MQEAAMSDGIFDLGFESSAAFTDDGGVYHNDRTSLPPLALERALHALPKLGTVLWSCRGERDRTFPRARLTSQGIFLFDHPALGVLADCTSVNAFSAVTSHGPREWLQLSDTQETPIAKLHLLPDTDYMAWDAMLAGSCVTAVPTGQRLTTRNNFLCEVFARRRDADWRARLARFPMLHLVGMRVMGLRAPVSVSALGRHIARDIADGERVAWQES